MTFVKAHWQIIVLTIAAFALYETPALMPLRLLVVFFHELSHGLTAILTGGSIVSLTLSPDEGGLATTTGGNLFLIVSAGYVGSLMVGVLLFLIALRTTFDRLAVAALGICTLLIAALYIRDSFALVFCGLAGAALLLVARFTLASVNDLVLRIIGLTSMLYVPQDIVSDTISRSHLRSDARILAEEFGGATVLWGVAWLIISMAAIGLTLRFGLGKNSNINFRGSNTTKAE
jgi:Peptidase M50B-like